MLVDYRSNLRLCLCVNKINDVFFADLFKRFLYFLVTEQQKNNNS